MIRRAITIRQPWAWPIAESIKDIENRTWFDRTVSGAIYIHAGKEPAEDFEQIRFQIARDHDVLIPSLSELQFGGFVAKAMFQPFVHESESPWFTGPIGYPIFSVVKIPFVPCRGAQGFWTIQENLKLAA